MSEQRDRSMRVRASVPDPTALLVIDEADRLKVSGLEQVRDIFVRSSVGLVLIGMPGIEKRLARYPQFYSRIGFVHEFRPLDAAAIRGLLDRGWTPPGVHLPQFPLDPETVAAIIRITGGNFRLLNRLLTQIERILEINALQQVTKTVVEAARESLVIGQGPPAVEHKPYLTFRPVAAHVGWLTCLRPREAPTYFLLPDLTIR